MRISAQELFRLLAERYTDKPDDFVLSIGHYAMPYPELPISIGNLPEFQAYVSISMKDVREWDAR